MVTEPECGDDISQPERHSRRMKKIPIILLAAGQSKRMRGQDKLLQQVDGMTLMRRSALTAMDAGEVFVALPPRPHDRYTALDGLDLHRIEVVDAAEGMNASLRRALAHIPSDAPAVMVLLADLPEITAQDLTAVLSAVIDHPDHLIWRGATASGKPGHPVVFDQSLFSELNTLSGDEGAQSVVRAHLDKVFLLPLPGEHALLDLDTPEDWARWRNQR